ncbi:glycosyltransferase family 4 protein [Nanoarchaeota archaeon]
MKVLMFGWEFPPHNSGGLGTACYGLTKSLNKLGSEITFILPHAKDNPHHFIKIIPTNLKTININSPLIGYMTIKQYSKTEKNNIYGPDLIAEVERYSELASEIAKTEPHDIIHAHDWMTYQAALKAKNISNKPLIIHVHATEFDRTGGHGVNPHVYQLEKMGMEKSDHIIAVSNFTKNKIIEHYHIPPEKISVVHNAVTFNNFKTKKKFKINQKDKVVLFLGRITIQKGPDYFITLAKRILDYDPNFKFIVAGSGDMEGAIIEKAAEFNIADKVLFTGFLRGPDLDQIYQIADLYIMPSISEPFGITPLEAMRNHTPCLISKQSGVSEVIEHCLKADFWDIDQMANQVISILKYPAGYQHLKENAAQEIRKFSWDKPAQECIHLYKKIGG